MNPKASFGNILRSKLRGIKYLLRRYNSTCNLQFADDLQVMHYVIVPLSFARGIIRLTLQTSLRSFSASLIKLEFQQ